MVDWKTIVDQYGQLVWSTAYRLVGNHADASDCFQETFLEAVKVARRENVRDWTPLLRHLATARALDLLRARYRRKNRIDAAAETDLLISSEAGPEQTAEAAELIRRLCAALPQLPSQQAEVFCLVCLDHLTYGEVGERLQLTTNSVGVLLHRARQRLRELLSPVDVRLTCDNGGANE
jgi:RNA polymerase sigma-70 factor (ECF subfamily)